MADNRAQRIAELKDAVTKAGTRYQSGKDGPSILKVKENFESMTPYEASTLLPLICENYKSLPPTNNKKLNEVMTKYTDKAKAAGYEDKAPTKKWQDSKDNFTKFMGILMKDVPEDFRNWAVILRALTDYMLPIVTIYKQQGNTEVKSLGYKGFFIFYFERAETQNYLKAQKFITLAIGKVVAAYLNTIREKGGSLLQVPRDFEGWLKLFTGLNKRIEVPSYDVWSVKAQAFFKSPSEENDLSDAALGKALQSWLLLRPGRYLIDKTQITKNRKVIPVDWANEIAESFGVMFKPFNGLFENVPEVGEIETPEDLNKQLAVHYRIIRNAIAAYRAVVFGGENFQLGPGQSRKLAIKLNLKGAFEKGLYPNN